MTIVLTAIAIVAALAAIVLGIPAVRRPLVSNRVLAVFRKVMPPMSQTEQEAIDAGTVWWDGELFSGKPDWAKLLAFPKPTLTAEEQSFLDSETEQLCAMVNDWETYDLGDLPPHAWQFIKDKGFLGMIIPSEYGGKGFSAYAHSQVVTKLSTRCSAAAVTVMVPNSLGPAELLLHYGTDEQKDHYLPRLAKGLDIPAFALTNPDAGSDAAAIPDTGIVCRGMWQGREVLGMRVTWDKRYITLGPDLHRARPRLPALRPRAPARRQGGPRHHLRARPDRHARREHRPPPPSAQRRVPERPQLRQGRVHADRLDHRRAEDGRPGLAHADGVPRRGPLHLAALLRDRRLQAFRARHRRLRARAQPVQDRHRQFEGVEEALARMGGNLYMMDAARVMTAGAVDLGEKPSVISAIVKYHLTERGRTVVNDAMDIHGGKGICLGPNNISGRAYQQIPVAITVEGANILTRSLIIFGQGAIRCHPYVLKEMQATRDTDRARASVNFDPALWGHIAFTVRNGLRAFFMGITGSHWVSVPAAVAPENRRYYQQLTRFSSAFAFIADVSMLVMGGSLKRREKLSARLGDMLSMMYLASAALKRYEDEGRQQADKPLLDWSIWDAMFRAQNAFEGVLSNYPNSLIATLLRVAIFPLGRPYVVPSDRLGHEVAKLLIAPSATRDRLTAGMFVGSADRGDVLAVIDAAMDAAIQAEAIDARIRAAHKAGTIAGRGAAELVQAAVSAGVITADERDQLARAAALRDRVVRVDDFPQDWSVKREAPTAGSARTRVAA